MKPGLTTAADHWPSRSIRPRVRGVGAAGAIGPTGAPALVNQLTRRVSSLPGLRSVTTPRGVDYWLDRRYWGGPEEAYLSWPVLLTVSKRGSVLMRLPVDHQTGLARRGWICVSPTASGCPLVAPRSAADLRTIWRVVLFGYTRAIAPLIDDDAAKPKPGPVYIPLPATPELQEQRV